MTLAWSPRQAPPTLPGLVADVTTDRLRLYAALRGLRLSRIPVRAVTGATTLTDADGLVVVDASGGACAATLPDVAANVERVFYVKKTDASANAVTVTRAGSATIDGATTYALTVQYQSVTVVSDGTNWHII